MIYNYTELEEQPLLAIIDLQAELQQLNNKQLRLPKYPTVAAQHYATNNREVYNL